MMTTLIQSSTPLDIMFDALEKAQETSSDNVVLTQAETERVISFIKKKITPRNHE